LRGKENPDAALYYATATNYKTDFVGVMNLDLMEKNHRKESEHIRETTT